MKALRICDVGLASDTSHAFHSMLQVVSGRSKVAWSVAPDIDAADVMIVACNGDAASFAACAASGKPIVLVIGDRDTRPPMPFVLRHPFRVMQLLSILDDVAEQFHAGPVAARTPTDDAAWRPVESLRQIMPHAGGDEWHCARTAQGASLWIGRGAAHAAPSVLAALRERDLGLAAFEPTRIVPQATLASMPLCDLAWHVGLHGSASLAPWLSPDAEYRLRRWPDVGRLGASTGLVELCAYAAAHAWTPARLASVTGQDLANVNRFLNAAALAGLLAATHASTGATRTREGAGVPGGWRRILGGLRRKLGLAA